MAMRAAKLEMNPYRRSNFGGAVPFVAVGFMSQGAKAEGQSDGVSVGAAAVSLSTILSFMLNINNIGEGLAGEGRETKENS
jgi:hypothetical protein